MRHLLSTQDLSLPDAIRILDTAEEMAAVGEREVKKLPALRGRTVVNLFFEDSTRTRISFEAAAKRLSADVINFAAKGSSVSKGESLKDTAQTLAAMGADAVVIRHWASGAPHRLAATDWIEAGRHAVGRGRPQGHARRHRRRRAALPGGPLQRLAAAHPRRRSHPRRAAHIAAHRRRKVALRR
jgi:aspartate carbamoyltransferase catalytic subunit